MAATSYNEADGVVGIATDQKGMAIIVVLIMLLLLSILGATMLASTTSDLQIAGNYRNSVEAFYAGDSALQFGETFDSIYSQIAPSVAASWPLPGQGTVLDSNYWPTSTANTAHPDYNHFVIPNTNDSADVKVELVGNAPGALPAGTGSQEDAGSEPGFKGNYYAVSVIAYGPNNTTAQFESRITRLNNNQ
jgi:Tfp pilus assembly protein PilX